MALRIALFGIYHESNTFMEKQTTIDDFRKGHWLKGADILKEYRGSFHEIGGMIEELENQGVEIIPVSFAEATPGGTIAAGTFTLLVDQLQEDLANAFPVDGCLIALHGAAVSEQYPDMDGHWLHVVRTLVGPGVPVVGTLDPHANVSQQMVEATDALFSYKTNPHMDQKETGKKAAALLLKIIRDEVKPLQSLVQSPVVISIEQQHTATEPCRGLYTYIDRVMATEDLLHISINLGFPYADVPEMGTSFIIIRDTKRAEKEKISHKLEAYMRAHRDRFVGERKNINELLPMIRDSPKPVLLLDMGDNIGGGGPGNSLVLLEFFENSRGLFKTLCCIHDPGAVEYLEKNSRDQVQQILLKGPSDHTLIVSASLLQLVDGKFTEDSPRHGGQVNYDMGASALLETVNRSTILLMSNRVPPFSLKQFTSFGVQVQDYDIVIAKGVIAPIAAYSPVCKTIIQVDTPGTTRADMTSFCYANRRKPLFPFESID